MSRLMSVAFTQDAVRSRQKTVTRRLGWKFAKPGDRVTLCRKVMGRKHGEPLERIADVELVSVTSTILDTITADEVVREGFPGWTPYEFVDFFCRHMKVESWVTVTRIEWRYVDSVEPAV